jgi:hypothetical protein
MDVEEATTTWAALGPITAVLQQPTVLTDLMDPLGEESAPLPA